MRWRHVPPPHLVVDSTGRSSKLSDAAETFLPGLAIRLPVLDADNMPEMRAPRPAQVPTLGKLRRPRLGRSIARDRLFEVIDRSQAVPALWIAGPAGYGKSTLVATYLESLTCQLLWLQLDAGDADPATFAHFLGKSAALLAPRKQIRMPLPTADDLRDVPGFIMRCFRRLVTVLDAPWLLVLDNVQELDRLPAMHAGLAAAVGEMPEGSRLIAISREPPPPQYARPLARQQMVVIEGSALRFTPDETQSLLNLHGRPWSAKWLCETTAGWAAAMILMLASRNELTAHDAAREGMAPQRLFDLFAGEVLESMESWQVEVLMRVAFLPSATGAMAVRLSGEPRAKALLEDLVHRSLFTGPPQ